ETGDVSITLNNRMLTELSRQEYLDVLNRELVPEEKPGKRNLLQSFFEGVNKGGRK
ncbi:TIGR00159 family protein, partial [Listeria monocytogenes]|nr:TIGR00159 family protein [Listeria monocytogenes]